MDSSSGNDADGYVVRERDAWAEAYSVHWDDNNKWDFEKNCWQESVVPAAASTLDQTTRRDDAQGNHGDAGCEAVAAGEAHDAAADGGGWQDGDMAGTWQEETGGWQDGGDGATGWGDAGEEDAWEADTWTTEENFLGALVTVTVSNCASDCEAWVQQHISLSEPDAVVRLGMDIEWRPEGPREYNQTATLQLSGAGHCLVVQLLHTDSVPEAICRLLRDPRVQVAGVGIQGDCEKLCTDHEGFEVACPVDLGELAADTMSDRSLRRAGLVSLGKAVLKLDLKPKNKHVTMSDWEVKRLSGAQMRYAAYDAWLAHAIFHKLATGRVDHIPLVAT